MNFMLEEVLRCEWFDLKQEQDLLFHLLFHNPQLKMPIPRLQLFHLPLKMPIKILTQKEGTRFHSSYSLAEASKLKRKVKPLHFP